ncbi:MAG: carbohydrate binding family 9 domain-containing protein, partial [Pyrinomonadaceae bacterium]
MMKKVSPAAALLAFALMISLGPAWREASAQQVASARTNVSNRDAAAGRVARLLKRMTLSTAETAEGSRVRITSDAALEGVETFTEGGRFFVLVPEADGSVLAAGGTAARGFSRVEAGRRGGDALIAFTLAPGVTPRVRASFNRLEILFAAQSGQQPTSGGDTSPTPTPTPSAASPSANDASTNPAASANPSAAAGNAAAGGAKAPGRGVPVPPEKANPVRIPRFDKPPTVDGKLDEEVWQQAAVFKDFYQTDPGDNIAPSQPTEARMGYDSKTLYIAFRAYDDPTKVRATVPKRDQIFDDDFVGVFLDTFNDQRKAYALFWNPHGVQADGIKTGDGNEDYSPDIVMESKGSLTSDGYVVEIAIPFKSLRYEAGKDKQWGVHLLRRNQRFNRELNSWMPLSRDVSGILNQAGHITGLEGISTE